MVGLPYPDRSDPELIQKIDYLNKRQQTEVEMKHKQEAISNGSSFLGAAPSSSLLSSSKPATPNGSNAGSKSLSFFPLSYHHAFGHPSQNNPGLFPSRKLV